MNEVVNIEYDTKSYFPFFLQNKSLSIREVWTQNNARHCQYEVLRLEKVICN